MSMKYKVRFIHNFDSIIMDAMVEPMEPTPFDPFGPVAGVLEFDFASEAKDFIDRQIDLQIKQLEDSIEHLKMVRQKLDREMNVHSYEE